MDYKLWWGNNKEYLLKRLKSLLWRTGVGLVLGLIALLLNILPDFQLPVLIVYIITNLAGEATKWLNSNTNLFGIKK
jgi:hypothetical protein